METSYLNRQARAVTKKITADLCKENSEDGIIKIFTFHLNDKNSSNFQKYYSSITTNEQNFLDKEKNFFKEFKSKYALSGIDNKYLQKLEDSKTEMLQRLANNEIVELYFDYFEKAEIRYNQTIIYKNLGSFLSKFAHTFNPNHYCALDNPIRTYFGMDKESFFMAFLIMSAAYKEWVNENPQLMQRIREIWIALCKDKKVEYIHFSDLKLLDLIYWYKANIPAPLP
ncbi:MAG: hypothetical protein K1X92_11380 [Bacteroidia bacterium]|nr:hypothetical protein [Bacteroidia bacterium]